MEDLKTHLTTCTLAFWHQPRYSSGDHGGDGDYRDFWRILHQAGADVVLSGHDHSYERFALQNHKGEVSEGGIRQFVVGTGGGSLYAFEEIHPNSEARQLVYGVLELTLLADSYEWRFVSTSRETLDSGLGDCSTPEE